MFSNLAEHDTNFSKTNIELYHIACQQFYKLIVDSFEQKTYLQNQSNALLKHLERWFITYSFALRKYYTHTNPSNQKIQSINVDAQRVLALPFMIHIKRKYFLKLIIFNIKTIFIRLKVLK
jgi:hypothetical protein